MNTIKENGIYYLKKSGRNLLFTSKTENEPVKIDLVEGTDDDSSVYAHWLRDNRKVMFKRKEFRLLFRNKPTFIKEI